MRMKWGIGFVILGILFISSGAYNALGTNTTPSYIIGFVILLVGLYMVFLTPIRKWWATRQ